LKQVYIKKLKVSMMFLQLFYLNRAIQLYRSACMKGNQPTVSDGKEPYRDNCVLMYNTEEILKMVKQLNHSPGQALRVPGG
jgi:hypothetical protein